MNMSQIPRFEIVRIIEVVLDRKIIIHLNFLKFQSGGTSIPIKFDNTGTMTKETLSNLKNYIFNHLDEWEISSNFGNSLVFENISDYIDIEEGNVFIKWPIVEISKKMEIVDEYLTKYFEHGIKECQIKNRIRKIETKLQPVKTLYKINLMKDDKTMNDQNVVRDTINKAHVEDKKYQNIIIKYMEEIAKRLKNANKIKNESEFIDDDDRKTILNWKKNKAIYILERIKEEIGNVQAYDTNTHPFCI